MDIHECKGEDILEWKLVILPAPYAANTDWSRFADQFQKLGVYSNEQKLH
jgi:hypothetical protein